jgi:hypothetical protein
MKMHWLTVISLGLFRPNVDGQIETVAKQGEEDGELYMAGYMEGFHRGASRAAARKRQELLGVDTLEEEDGVLDVPIVEVVEEENDGVSMDYSSWSRPELMREYRERKGKPAKTTATKRQLVSALNR